MSGDRVDVLDRLSVSQHCKQCKYCAVIAKSVSPRIAELIEAANEVSKVFDGDAALDRRLYEALRACRQKDLPRITK